MAKLPAGWPARIPHPGWACCDPEQDLAAWVVRQREILAKMRRSAAEARSRGEEADQAALAGAVKALGDEGYRHQHQLEQARQRYHGEANAIMQSVLIHEGHLERVVAAHPWRFTP